jgi:methionine synthase reductase
VRGVQKKQLQHMTSRDGKAEFHEFVTAAQRSILEVFQEFPSVKVPFEHLVQLLPRLTPRAYTICSSPVVNSNTVHLAVSLIQTVSRVCGARACGCLHSDLCRVMVPGLVCVCEVNWG